MFKSDISTSPLLNEPANSIMGHIRGDRFMGDCSFVATLRALLFSRVPKDEQVVLKISRSDYSSDDVKNTRKRDMVKNICSHNNQIGQRGGFALHYFSNMTLKANQDCMSVIESEFENTYPGYKRLDKITAFYQKAFPVICFLNPEIKSVVLFVEQMDNRRFHYLQCAILPMVPWYFNRETGITPVEKKLLESLMESKPDNYRDCIAKIYESFDFRSELIRQKLKGFELRYIEDAMVAAKSQYGNITNNIADFTRRLDEELRKLSDINFKIAGMQAKIDEGGDDSEIMDYFLANKNLTLVDSYDSRVDFIVRAKLEYYDPEMAERAVANKNSLLYTRGSGMNKEDRNMLWRALFVDNTISINVCAAFRLSINGGVNTNGHYSFGEEFANCMPHPHIDEYNCMGDYVRIVNELMQNHDYIMALEQCIASARSLNFADSTVLGHFVNTLMSGDSRSRCIELPDGSVVKPTDAVKWLKEQEAGSK